MAVNTCETCLYSMPYQGNDVMTCHRNAPRPQASAEASWPQVRMGDGCGEWQPDNEPV